VGGGSAGAVAAFRLSENGKHSVLLLEAGGYPSSIAHMPSVVALLQQSEINWKYFTEPQINGTKSLNNQVSL
jgi:choline dehydrogenase